MLQVLDVDELLLLEVDELLLDAELPELEALLLDEPPSKPASTPLDEELPASPVLEELTEEIDVELLVLPELLELVLTRQTPCSQVSPPLQPVVPEQHAAPGKPHVAWASWVETSA